MAVAASRAPHQLVKNGNISSQLRMVARRLVKEDCETCRRDGQIWELLKRLMIHIMTKKCTFTVPLDLPSQTTGEAQTCSVHLDFWYLGDLNTDHPTPVISILISSSCRLAARKPSRAIPFHDIHGICHRGGGRGVPSHPFPLGFPGTQTRTHTGSVRYGSLEIRVGDPPVRLRYP